MLCKVDGNGTSIGAEGLMLLDMHYILNDQHKDGTGDSYYIETTSD